MLLTMAWNSEIKDATYTSPSGKTYTFRYGQLSKETELKTATFTFPEKDGALVVPLGVGGRTFPMSCFFYGADCLDEADAFEEGLKERGYGELQHPIYGVHKVVPVGQIKRSDDLVGALNASQVDITFAETLIDETFPDSEILNQDQVVQSVENFQIAAAHEFDQDMNSASASESLRVQGLMKSQERDVTDNLSGLAKKSVSTYTNFQEIDAEAKSNIPLLNTNKADIATQLIKLIDNPSKLSIPVIEKMGAYSQLISDTINKYSLNSSGINAAKNQFISTRLILESALVSLCSGIALTINSSGVIDSPANESSTGVTTMSSNPGKFRSREEAVKAAVELSELYDQVVEYLDSKIDEDMLVETGEGFNAMRDVVFLSIKLIVDQSFNLATRKTIRLGKARQIMELIAELYGDFDRLDEFIVDNHLTYDEIQLMPLGREVSYYV